VIWYVYCSKDGQVRRASKGRCRPAEYGSSCHLEILRSRHSSLISLSSSPLTGVDPNQPAPIQDFPPALDLSSSQGAKAPFLFWGWKRARSLQIEERHTGDEPTGRFHQPKTKPTDSEIADLTLFSVTCRFPLDQTGVDPQVSQPERWGFPS